MPAIVVLGAQWGDEGKGKATDLLATTETIDYVVRTSGGHNAGHTLSCTELAQNLRRKIAPVQDRSSCARTLPKPTLRLPRLASRAWNPCW